MESERIGMIINLLERSEAVLKGLDYNTTFKIPESSFVYMKLDIEGLTILPIPSSEILNVEPEKVQIPEGKIPVVCLNNGKAQFLNATEKVQIVELVVDEILKIEGE